MAREIKFRAWDKWKNKMVPVDGINFNEFGFPQFKASSIAYNETNFVRLSEVELMQFTGLKDKNGVEIYTGDVVQIEKLGNKEVVFSQGCFQVHRYGGLAPLRYLSLINSETVDCEVIGNIYQNHELLREG